MFLVILNRNAIAYELPLNRSVVLHIMLVLRRLTEIYSRLIGTILIITFTRSESKPNIKSDLANKSEPDVISIMQPDAVLSKITSVDKVQGFIFYKYA
uniref:Uncharacterized protein n=1 Tax=Glossina palpalis gambiensis TaxID=67801 RepID=A0A1B0AVU3_9MUSC